MQITADERLDNFFYAGGMIHVSLNSVDRKASSTRRRRRRRRCCAFNALASRLSSSSSGCSSISNSSGVGFFNEEVSVGL